MIGPVAIDANLLLLLIVGSSERRYIDQHKRLKHVYSPEDFDLLVQLLDSFTEIILLPNTLTEVSNFSRQIADPAKSRIALTMKILIEGAREQFVPSNSAANRPEFFKLGLTDSALLEFSSIQTEGPVPTLLTADLDLAIAAEMNGYRVENFNHWRDLA